MIRYERKVRSTDSSGNRRAAYHPSPPISTQARSSSPPAVVASELVMMSETAVPPDATDPGTALPEIPNRPGVTGWLCHSVWPSSYVAYVQALASWVRNRDKKAPNTVARVTTATMVIIRLADLDTRRCPMELPAAMKRIITTGRKNMPTLAIPIQTEVSERSADGNSTAHRVPAGSLVDKSAATYGVAKINSRMTEPKASSCRRNGLLPPRRRIPPTTRAMIRPRPPPISSRVGQRGFGRSSITQL